MGEYADMAIDDMLSLDEYQLLNPEEFEGEDLSWSPFGRVRFSRRSIPRCDICHKSHLYWRQRDNGDWFLAEWDGKKWEYQEHVCKFKWK